MTLVAGILIKLVDNVLERRRAGSTDRRADEASALAQVQAVWNELRQLKEDHAAEIDQMREEHAADMAELRTVVELHKHRTGAAEKRALLAEQERDRLLAKIAPLEAELKQLRRRVKELEEAAHG